MSTDLAAPAQLETAQSSSSAPLSGEARYQKIGENVEREVMVHRTLYHPHVIQFNEVFLTPQHLAIVMEYAAGGNMLDHVNRLVPRTMSEADARWFYQQIIIAMDYCHRKGVALRDIKLENTLLANKEPGMLPLIKLCDFGYSKHAGLHSAPHSKVGTTAYLAPEIIKSDGKTKYDGPAADVWSSGVMLYTMLAGCYPFSRREDRGPQADLNMIRRILTLDYVIPIRDLKLSPDCKDFVERILVLDPAQRITVQQITQHKWFQKNLPPCALGMNDKYLNMASGQQSEETIRRIIQEAKRLPGAPPAPAGNGPNRWTQAGRDYVDDSHEIDADTIISAQTITRIIAATPPAPAREP